MRRCIGDGIAVNRQCSWAGLLLNGRVLAYIIQDSELQRKEPVWKSMILALHNPKNRKEQYTPVG